MKQIRFVLTEATKWPGTKRSHSDGAVARTPHLIGLVMINRRCQAPRH